MTAAQAQRYANSSPTKTPSRQTTLQRLFSDDLSSSTSVNSFGNARSGARTRAPLSVMLSTVHGSSFFCAVSTHARNCVCFRDAFRRSWSVPGLAISKIYSLRFNVGYKGAVNQRFQNGLITRINLLTESFPMFGSNIANRPLFRLVRCCRNKGNFDLYSEFFEVSAPGHFLAERAVKRGPIRSRRRQSTRKPR